MSEQKIVTGRVYVAPVGTEPDDPGWTEIGSADGIKLDVISSEVREDGVYVTAQVPEGSEHILDDPGAHFSVHNPPGRAMDVNGEVKVVDTSEERSMTVDVIPTYHTQKVLRELMRGVRKEPERYVPNRADRRRAARNRKKDR